MQTIRHITLFAESHDYWSSGLLSELWHTKQMLGQYVDHSPHQKEGTGISSVSFQGVSANADDP